MQGTVQQLSGRSGIGAVYRIIICFCALAVIFASAALELSIHFSPQNLELKALSGGVSFEIPVTLKENEEMQPVTEAELKKEIAYTEAQDREASPQKSKEETEGFYLITETDLSRNALPGEIIIQDSDSGISVDAAEVLNMPFPADLKKENISMLSAKQQPLVLILHTHATECYTEEGDAGYSTDTSFRSHDTSKNMVAVGQTMTDVLNSLGVPTLHCKTLHDAEDFNQSYPNSLASAKQYLEQFPSIKYIFDVHRDAIIRDNSEALKPVCSINGVSTAQTMTLVGTDAGGADHPHWLENNMNLAVKLQDLLTRKYTGMARPINTRNASFNQQHAPGFLLFEVGSCANTLEEAQAAAVNLATAIAEIINTN